MAGLERVGAVVREPLVRLTLGWGNRHRAPARRRRPRQTETPGQPRHPHRTRARFLPASAASPASGLSAAKAQEHPLSGFEGAWPTQGPSKAQPREARLLRTRGRRHRRQGLPFPLRLPPRRQPRRPGAVDRGPRHQRRRPGRLRHQRAGLPLSRLQPDHQYQDVRLQHGRRRRHLDDQLRLDTGAWPGPEQHARQHRSELHQRQHLRGPWHRQLPPPDLQDSAGRHDHQLHLLRCNRHDRQPLHDRHDRGLQAGRHAQTQDRG